MWAERSAQNRPFGNLPIPESVEYAKQSFV